MTGEIPASHPYKGTMPPARREEILTEIDEHVGLIGIPRQDFDEQVRRLPQGSDIPHIVFQGPAVAPGRLEALAHIATGQRELF